MKTHLTIRTLLGFALLSSWLSVPTYAQDGTECNEVPGKVIHYCNLNVEGDGPGGKSLKHSPFPSDDVLAVAQKFTAGSAGNVSSVTLGLNRLGTPGGNMIISIYDVDPRTGFPLNSLGTLGVVEANSLPQVDWCSLPKQLQPVTVEGLVEGLVPGSDYFLSISEDPADQPFLDGGPLHCGGAGPWNGWTFDAVPAPADAQHELVNWPLTFGGPLEPWGPYEETRLHLRVRARIVGTSPPPEPLAIEIDTAISISWESKADRNYRILSSTKLENWAEAVASIEGTGEKITWFFEREAQSTYYRVEELERP